jgi:4-amino-4-deoxy-L-arabinose transferase-like glycosyltransferase
VVDRIRRLGASIAGRRFGPHVVLAGLALVLRLGWVLSVRRRAFAFNDAIMYHTSAISVSRLDGYVPLTGGPTARWPPGFSTVLGGLYAVFGIRPVVGEIFNAAVGAATVVLLMLIVERAVDRRTAIVAGAMLAVLPGPILWTDVLVSETVYTAVFMVAVLILVHAAPTWRWALLIGAVVGVGSLFRGEALTWLLLPVVAWWGTVPYGSLVRRMAIAVGAVAVVIAPWTIRNAIAMDAFVPVATNASQTLWSGHNPGATGGQTYPPAGFEDQFGTELPARELEASAALRSEAIQYVVRHPLRELELIPLKLIHLNRGDSYALDWVNAPGTGAEPPLSAIDAERIGVVADAGYFSLLATAVLGAWWLGRGFWRTRVGRLVATSMLTMCVLYGFVYYGNYRYRMPYEPLMVIVAATFVTRLRPLRRAAGAIDTVAP